MSANLFISDALNYFSWDYFCREDPIQSSESLMKELSLCPQSRALIEEAQEVIKDLGLGALEVRLAKTNFKFRAKTEGNIITIDPDLPASEQRYLAVFELTNVIHLKKFVELCAYLANGLCKSSEEWVRRSEYIEYKGNIRAKAVAVAINEEKGRFFRPYFKDSWRFIPIDCMGFDLYYNFFLGDNHIAHTRNNYWKIVKELKIKTSEDISHKNKNWFKTATKIFLLAVGFIFISAAISINVHNMLKLQNLL